MWVTGARLVVTTLLLASTAFFYLRGGLSGYSHSMSAVFGTVALEYAVAITVVSMLAGYLSERLRQTGGALEVARRRYTEAERLAELGRISAWLAHEIRNPLGSISGSIEMLREGETLTPEEKELCDI